MKVCVCPEKFALLAHLCQYATVAWLESCYMVVSESQPKHLLIHVFNQSWTSNSRFFFCGNSESFPFAAASRFGSDAATLRMMTEQRVYTSSRRAAICQSLSPANLRWQNWLWRSHSQDADWTASLYFFPPSRYLSVAKARRKPWRCSKHAGKMWWKCRKMW